MTRLKLWQTGLAFALLLTCTACVAVPYDDGPPGPAPGYYGAYPEAYPWAGSVNVDLGHGYGHGGYYDHGGYGGYGHGGYGHGFSGGHGGFGGSHGGHGGFHR